MFFFQKLFRCSRGQLQQSCIAVFDVNENVGNGKRWRTAKAGLTAGAISREPIVTASRLSTQELTAKFGCDAEVSEYPLRRLPGRFGQRREIFIAQVGNNCPEVSEREIDERCF